MKRFNTCFTALLFIAGIAPPLESAHADSYTSAQRFETQRHLERYYEDRLKGVFKRLGVRAVVRVSAEMDWSRRKELIEESTEGAAVSTMSTASESRSGAEKPPGARANIPAGSVGNDGSSQKHEELIENYSPSQSSYRETTPPGLVRRLHVAVFVEGDYVQSSGSKGYVPVPVETLRQYHRFISRAVASGREPPDIVVMDHPFAARGRRWHRSR